MSDTLIGVIIGGSIAFTSGFIIEIFKQLEKDQIIEIENYIQKFIEK